MCVLGGGCLAEGFPGPAVPAEGKRKKNSPVSCCWTAAAHETHGPNFTAVDGGVRADAGAETSMQSAGINTSVIVTFA